MAGATLSIAKNGKGMQLRIFSAAKADVIRLLYTKEEPWKSRPVASGKDSHSVPNAHA